MDIGNNLIFGNVTRCAKVTCYYCMLLKKTKYFSEITAHIIIFHTKWDEQVNAISNRIQKMVCVTKE